MDDRLHALPVPADMDWADIGRQLDAEGHAVLPGLLSPHHVGAMIDIARSGTGLRAVALAAEGLGDGERYYFDPALPDLLAIWRDAFYRLLVPIANRWNGVMGLDLRFAPQPDTVVRHNRVAGQCRPLSHFNLLGSGDYIALHQNTAGAYVFPLQLVALLSQPDDEFSGGELVTTEQRPRMQSRPAVVPLRRSDVAILCTGRRPVRGSRGPYPVNLKHAISPVHHGQRLGLELYFHDAPQ